MTSQELKRWMAAHGYSVRRLALALEVNPSTVQRWREGAHEIPPYLIHALNALAVNGDSE